MTILVTGSTGTIGSQVLAQLRSRNAQVRALTRSPQAASFPDGVTAVQGELGDIDALRRALQGVSTLFLLAPAVSDELTQTMQALTLAREAGVKGIVYLSVFQSDTYADVPHFAGKYTVERMIEAFDVPATILRPAYFIQNDLRQKDLLLHGSAYGSPIGALGVSMVDIRDIGEAAAIELVRRETSPIPLPAQTYELVGPDALTSDHIADLWTKALGRPIRPSDNDLAAFEARARTIMPAWHALDLRLMFAAYQSRGAIAPSNEVSALTTLLGHPPRSYADFAVDTASAWLRRL